MISPHSFLFIPKVVSHYKGIHFQNMNLIMLFLSQNSSKGQWEAIVHYKVQHETCLLPISAMSSEVKFLVNTLSTPATHIPLSHFSNIYLPWLVVVNNFISAASIHIKYVMFVCGVHMQECVNIKQILAMEPDDVLRCFLSCSISFLKMPVATHQIALRLTMDSVPTTWKTPIVGLNRVLSIQFYLPGLVLPLCLLILISVQRNLPGLPLPHNYHHHQTRTEFPVGCFIVSYAFHHCTYPSSHRWFMFPYPDYNLREIMSNVC